MTQKNRESLFTFWQKILKNVKYGEKNRESLFTF